MTIKPVLVPDHDAAALRGLMDRFAEAATGPTRQQLAESRAAVAAAQGVAEGAFDIFKKLPPSGSTVKIDGRPVKISYGSHGGEDNSHVNFSWNDTNGKEHYVEARVETIPNLRALAKRIKGEMDWVEQQNAAQGVAEATGQQLNIQQLATISDEALDNAYHYGRSTPGNTFGWQANLKSAAYAKQMIDQGVTDIEAISDAIHKGWNVTARAFVQNPEQFSDTEKLQAAGKLEAKLQQRTKLMNIGYSQLPDEEQEKDRVVARALLQALKGKQGVAEDLNEAIGGNYLYHATGGLKNILASGQINAARGPQQVTNAQTKLPTVSTTRNWNYAVGGKGTTTPGLDRDAIIVLDRNAVESNFKTLGTSQSREQRGLSSPRSDDLYAGKAARDLDVNKDNILNKKDADEWWAQHQAGKDIFGQGFAPRFGKLGDLRANIDQKIAQAADQFQAPKRGGEFEEAVVVPQGGLPIKGTMVGFYIPPSSPLMKDPEIVNDPRRLDLEKGGTGRFVKASQQPGVSEGVAEGSMYSDEEVSWEKGGRRAPTGAFRNPAAEPMPVNKYIAQELDTLLKLAQDQVDDITNRSRDGYGNNKSSGLEDAIFELSGVSNGFHSSMAEGVAELQELNSGLPRIGNWIMRNLKKVGNRIDLPQLIKQETSNNQGVTETHDNDARAVLRNRIVADVLNFYSLNDRIPSIKEFSRPVRAKLNALEFDERSTVFRQAVVQALKLLGKQGMSAALTLDEHGDPWEDPNYDPRGGGETRSPEQIAKDNAEHAILSKKLGLKNTNKLPDIKDDMLKMMNHFRSQHSDKKDVSETADVMRHKGDTTVKVVKRAGKPIGEIGIDAEASEGNGRYYVKLYDGSYDAVGFDTAEEALAELKYAIKSAGSGPDTSFGGPSGWTGPDRSPVGETSAADGVKYGVFAKGGSVGSQRFRDDPLKTFDTKEEATADARRRRSGLSKGERGYYGMGYVVKPIRGDVEEGWKSKLAGAALAGAAAFGGGGAQANDQIAKDTQAITQAIQSGQMKPREPAAGEISPLQIYSHPKWLETVQAMIKKYPKNHEDDQRAMNAAREAIKQMIQQGNVREGSAEQVDEKSESVRHSNNDHNVYHHVDESVDPVEQLRADIKRFAQ